MSKRKKASPRLKQSEIVIWIAAIAVAAGGIFCLPWFIAPTMPVPGESYAFGYNNRAGTLALALAIFLATVARFISARRSVAYKWLVVNPVYFPPWKEARAEYAILICFSAVLCGAITFWNNYLVDPAWCEARGFIYGIDLLALGQVPYRDFMFNYGPSTLYLPFLISKITRGAFSFEQSYGVALVLFTMAGLGGLFVFLRSLEIGKQVRPLILFLALTMWMVMTMGLQYTPIRFLVVAVSLVFLDAIARRLPGKGDFIRVAFAAAISVGLSLAVSPEMGIACTLGVMAYGFILLLRRSILLSAACWTGAVAMFAGNLLLFPAYLDSVLDFGSGVMNFPVYPNLYNLCVVAVCLVTLPGLIASAVANPSEPTAPLSLAFAVGGGMILPAAFGRSDPGHVAINSVIPILIMFPVAYAAGKIAFRFWTAVYAVLFFILLQYNYWTQYVVNFEFGIKSHQFYDDHPAVVAAWKTKWDALRLSMPRGRDLYWGKVLPFPEELTQLTSKGRMLLATGSEGAFWIARFLLLQNPPPRDYFVAYGQGASTPAQIAVKVKQDEAFDFLIVPEWTVAPLFGQIDLDAYQRSETAMMSNLLLFPVNSEVKNTPYMPETEFARQIQADYKPLGRYNSFVIFEKRNLRIR